MYKDKWKLLPAVWKLSEFFDFISLYFLVFRICQFLITNVSTSVFVILMLAARSKVHYYPSGTKAFMVSSKWFLITLSTLNTGTYILWLLHYYHLFFFKLEMYFNWQRPSMREIFFTWLYGLQYCSLEQWEIHLKIYIYKSCIWKWSTWRLIINDLYLMSENVQKHLDIMDIRVEHQSIVWDHFICSQYIFSKMCIVYK